MSFFSGLGQGKPAGLFCGYESQEAAMNALVQQRLAVEAARAHNAMFSASVANASNPKGAVIEGEYEVVDDTKMIESKSAIATVEEISNRFLEAATKEHSKMISKFITSHGIEPFYIVRKDDKIMIELPESRVYTK